MKSEIRGLVKQGEDKRSVELWVWGLAKGETEQWKETMLACTCKTQADVEAVKAAASKDGWHSFRVSKWDGSAPNFSGVVKS